MENGYFSEESHEESAPRSTVGRPAAQRMREEEVDCLHARKIVEYSFEFGV